MAKTKVVTIIDKSKETLKKVMLSNLEFMSNSLITQIMRNYRKATKSQQINAAKNVIPSGLSTYKQELLETMAIIAGLAIETAREDLPKKAKTKLALDEESLLMGEFDKLPPTMRRRLKSQMELLTKTQREDLEKAIMFQFSSSVESTDSGDTIEYDLFESADKWMNGPSVDAGAGVMAARTVNESRSAFFQDDEVSEGIEAFIFLNDDPETPICQDLVGTIFSKDDPGADRYYPPLHYNCKSYIDVILVGDLGDRQITRLQPSSKELDKYVQFNEDHNFKCGCMRLTDMR